MNPFEQTSVFYIESPAALEQALAAVREFRAAGEGRPITLALTADLYLQKPVELNVSGVTLDGQGHRIGRCAIVIIRLKIALFAPILH
ncbi:MAG: hypothetical protein IJC46_02015 [Clostridia bacterium]|nr:hypothetical protein [Clostridia bacterium]